MYEYIYNTSNIFLFTRHPELLGSEIWKYILQQKGKTVHSVRIKSKHVRFQVLTAASMMFRIVFWDILPCKIIVDRRTSETSVDNHFTR
jgi:hypothetical protein